MVKRLIRWLLEIPPKDRLEAHRSLAAERDRRKSGGIEASDPAYVAGSRRAHGPQGW